MWENSRQAHDLSRLGLGWMNSNSELTPQRSSIKNIVDSLQESPGAQTVYDPNPDPIFA